MIVLMRCCVLLIGFCSAVVNGQSPVSEYRQLWIATVENIDWPSSAALSSSDQLQELARYLDILETTNFNSAIFQVRPVGDALYNSTLEPWSKYLTGTQGVAPDPYYDPLEAFTSEAHARGIEVHAWVNPYRANYAPTWEGLDPSHMAVRWPQFAYQYGDYLWMDPGASVVLDHFIDVISDIFERYAVDGIHFDDYFYPYPEAEPFPDNATYGDYLSSGGDLSLSDWRRDNINRMVQRVHDTAQTYDRKLSISPFGLYRTGHPEGMPPPLTGFDPYEEMYADSKLWFQEGWMDTFIPQIYWEIEPPEQSFPLILDWWLTENSRPVQLCSGLAVYKVDPERGDWPVAEIVDQVLVTRTPANRARLSDGTSMFGAKYLRDDLKGILGILQSGVYNQTADVPALS